MLSGLSRIDFHPRSNVSDRLFVYLLAASVVLRFAWLEKPAGSLIFDETYYVNVARIILGWPHDPRVYPDAPWGVDPNHEHPPLAKLLIALTMAALGDNAYAWRLPSIIFGVLALFLFYLLMKKIATHQWVPIVAAFLFSFDNLAFVHSRIATLDIFTLTFMLLGFYLYVINRTALASSALALSTLTKIGGFYGFLTLGLYHVVKSLRSPTYRQDLPKLLAWIEKYTLVYAAVFLALLFVLDRLWGGYANPFDHLQFIYSYTISLVRDQPAGIESYPWQWLWNEVKIPYLRVDVNVFSDSVILRTYPTIAFLGAMNPALIYLTVPAIGYAVYDYYKTRSDFSLFTLAWFASTYLPFYPLAIFGHRIMYIFYFLNTVPAVAGAVSHMFLDQNPPKIILLVYLGAVIVGYGMMFPFKTAP